MYIAEALIAAATSGIAVTAALNFAQKRKAKKPRQLPTTDA